jgi:hypothetical protein
LPELGGLHCELTIDCHGASQASRPHKGMVDVTLDVIGHRRHYSSLVNRTEVAKLVLVRTKLTDFLLAAGVLLSTASQLRLPGMPIGPGETCLAVWLLLMFGRTLLRDRLPLSPALSQLLVFWLIFVIALSLGTLTALVIGDRHDEELFRHDIIAYLLLAPVSCLSVLEPEAALRLRRSSWLLVSLGSVALAFQLASAKGYFSTVWFDPMYWDRMRGWSASPDQLALLCIVLGLLAVHLADTAATPGASMAAMAGIILPVWVGWLTKADTFNVVLVASMPFYIGLKAVNWLWSATPKLTFRSAFAWLMIAILLPLSISIVATRSILTPYATSIAQSLSKDNGNSTQGELSLRLEIWTNALTRGLEAGMIGLGPGPHLQTPASLVAARLIEVEPKNLSHPELNSTPNFEAHNTLFDLFLQGGVIAVMNFVWLIFRTFSQTYRAKLAGLSTLLFGLSLYGLPTLIIRHPAFWFAVAVSLATAQRPRPTVVGGTT